jgi:hypothetical protein
MLGFSSSKIEVDGSPDPWWSLGNYCLVFEDHANASPNSTLGAEKARQAADHPRWIRQNVPNLANAEIVPVLVSPVRRASAGARPHLSEVSYWPLDEFRQWAITALAAIREIRKTFSESSDLLWRAEAASKLRSAGLDFPTIIASVRSRRATELVDE